MPATVAITQPLILAFNTSNQLVVRNSTDRPELPFSGQDGLQLLEKYFPVRTPPAYYFYFPGSGTEWNVAFVQVTVRPASRA